MNKAAKLLLGTACGLFIALPAFGACEPKPVPAGSTDFGAPVELKLGHIQSETDFWHLGSVKFKEELEKRSNGNLTLAIFPNSTLGGDRDLVEGMQMGTVDFGLVAGVLGNFAPSIQLLELPYLFDDHDQFVKVVYGPIGKKISDDVYKNSTVCLLSWWDRGPREVTSNKPINTLADIQGLKIRLPEIAAMVDTWKHMGATPTPMAWSEVYTGLQQGVIEAQENPIPFIYGGRIHEVQKYIAMTDHKYEYVTITMSGGTWDKLSPLQQKVMIEAAEAATEYENALVRDKTKELLDEMVKGGMQVTNPDKKEFAAKAREAHETFAKSVDLDLYKEILKTIGR
ncbi:MAG: TRAP transporter substrate-binding protein [Methylobacteriaceae bacterium]|jgi:tripartite ATP-independent transporter DctP family solute receptor|nr:TRAP transporter substrate-binding protein [Methylobacteriaceae bacterium]